MITESNGSASAPWEHRSKILSALQGRSLLPFVFLLKSFEKSFHEGVTLLRQTFPFCSEHPVFDLGELELEFPIPRVLFRVRLGVVEVHFRIVKLGSYLPGKQKSPADTDRTDGIEFVRVKQGSGLQRFSKVVSAKPVGSNAVDDVSFFSMDRG